MKHNSQPLFICGLLSCQGAEKRQVDTSQPMDTLSDSIGESGSHHDTTDSGSYTPGYCPPYSGLNVEENTYESVLTYLTVNPPYQVAELELNGLREEYNTPEFTIHLEGRLSDDYQEAIYYPYHYLLEIGVSGEIHIRCDEDGYWELGRTLTLRARDLFERHELTTTVTTTWDPPALVLPAQVMPGDEWTVESTKTTIFSSGTSTAETIRETRRAVGIEIVDWGWRDAQTEALVVEGDRGGRLWYIEDIGIARGEGLTLVGGGLGSD